MFVNVGNPFTFAAHHIGVPAMLPVPLFWLSG